MKTTQELENFIISNFDNALKEHHIKLYFQPVIRTISRKVCGAEVLSRWIDPEIGFLNPGQYIKTLENKRLIHKLDSYIIWEVCNGYRKSLSKDKNVLPISFNISRIDFEMCDMVAVVEEAVTHFEIPRELINIEITESALNDNSDLIRSSIERFQSAGYHVWMDDFGAGYSSLNVLKEYTFDELKIDMMFLINFDTRGRAILRAVVDMAKALGIQTLAEGVETEEEYQFLLSIGCEKVQGYLFGKPLPYYEFLENLRIHEIDMEMQWERHYYDIIGSVNVISQSPFIFEHSDKTELIKEMNAIPLAIIELANDTVSFLYSNAAFIKELNIIGIDNAKDALHKFRTARILSGNKLLKIFKKTKISGHENVTITENGQYFAIRTQLITRENERYAMLISFENLSKTDISRKERLDKILRNIYSMYDGVYVLNVTDGLIETLYLTYDSYKYNDQIDYGEFVENFIYQKIYIDDREIVQRFLAVDTIYDRVCASDNGLISIQIRVCDIHKNHSWKVLIALKAGNSDVLFLLKDADTVTIQKASDAIEDNTGISDALLWKTLLQNSSLGIFWKDKNRRFLGANKVFLDYYNMEGPEVILGKNDEEVGWHIDPGPYKSDEESVINEGNITKDVPGKCIVNGAERNIAASKMPIYKDGQRVGLLGYFRDITDTSGIANAKTSTTDHLTGLLNTRGMMEIMFRYVDSYEINEQDFYCMLISIDNFDEIIYIHGKHMAGSILKTISKAITNLCKNTCNVGRLSGDKIIILGQFADSCEPVRLQERLRDTISSIHSVDGRPCTFYPALGFALYSENKNIDELIQASRKKMHEDHKKHMDRFNSTE